MMLDGIDDEAGRTHPDALDAARELAAKRRESWPRRRVSGRVAVLMWFLRVYVLGMLGVVALQLVRLV